MTTMTKTPTDRDLSTFEALDLTGLSITEIADLLRHQGGAHLGLIERIELAERLTRRRFIIGAGVMGLGMLTGCGPQEDVVEPTIAPANTGYPRTITHDTGMTQIIQKPERILTVGEYALELALVLQQQPVAIAVLPQIVPDATSGKPVTTIAYYDEYLTSTPIYVGAFAEPSLEAMAAAQPDLVLAYSFPAASKLETFGQIAPTLEYDFLATGGWQRFIGAVAEAFDAVDSAQAYVTDFTERVTAARQQLASRLANGARVNFVTLFGPDLFLFSETSSVGSLFQQLGMTWALPSGVSIPENGFAPGSLEAIATTEADIVILHNYGAPAETLNQVTDLLRSALPDSVFVLDYRNDPFLGVAGPISERIFLDRVVTLLRAE